MYEMFNQRFESTHHTQTGFQIFLRAAKTKRSKTVFRQDRDYVKLSSKEDQQCDKEEHTRLEDCCQSEASLAQEQSSQPHDLESKIKMLWRINSGLTLEKYSI